MYSGVIVLRELLVSNPFLTEVVMGLAYVCILWGIVILIATGAGISFIVTNTKAYLEATITTNIESTSENLSVSNKNRNKCSKLQINLLVLL